jgi:hypothetical protein
MPEKSCFVISPIGEKGSDIKNRSDEILNYLIKPITTGKHDYDTKCADEISETGKITHQIIQRLIEADLVIADLSGHNPNVLYELAVRHCAKKPYIQIINENEKIPFDIADLRTIKFNWQSPGGIEKFKATLDEYITNIEKNPEGVYSPITAAVDLQSLKTFNEKENKELAPLMKFLERIFMLIEGKMGILQDSVEEIKHERGYGLGLLSTLGMGNVAITDAYSGVSVGPAISKETAEEFRKAREKVLIKMSAESGSVDKEEDKNKE